MPRKTLEERFWEKVDRRGPDECWPWTGMKNSKGYGRIEVEGRRRAAHRIGYQLIYGPVPEELVMHHLCENRICCNPAHLIPTTNKINVLLGNAPSAKAARATHCKRGHEYTEENTRIPKSGGKRSCRTCCREYMRRKRANGYKG